MPATMTIINDRITGMIYARFPDSELALARFTNGDVYIGRIDVPGATLSRVTNPDFDYAETPGAFRDLAHRFLDASTEDQS